MAAREGVRFTNFRAVFRTAMSDVVEVTTKFELPRVQRRSCAAIGTAILAEARLVLTSVWMIAPTVK